MSLHTAVATIHTNKGDVRVNLFGNHAPKTVKNFVDLATGKQEWTHPGTGKVSTDKLYDGVVFHRIIKDFMIQGGDPLGQGIGGRATASTTRSPRSSRSRSPTSWRWRTPASRVVVARTARSSSSPPWPHPWLQGKHTIFGVVADDESRAVVDAIEGVPTDGRDKPVDDVVIESIDVEDV